MKKFHHPLLLFVLVLFTSALVAQTLTSSSFFGDEKPFEMTLTSDFKTLLAKRIQKNYQPATITMRFPDSSILKEDIRIQTRGKFRLENCYMPPLGLNFNNPTSPKLKPLKKLKLVVGCATTTDDEQLIIKEYLAYKMYNFLTEKSFRVRLVKIRFEDTKGKVKPYTQYGFLLEDVDEMAARNKCVEVQGKQHLTEQTDREQMTMVNLFEYMIGNTDWSVPHYHNIKLMRPKSDSLASPYAVPYDLNHCGLVNAPYALPQEELGIESVKERLYRGFPRSQQELDKAIAVFQKQRESIKSLVSNCDWLSNKYKREVNGYIEDFYRVIDSKREVKNTFIDNARTQ